jgi:hypothetical protein
MLIICIHDTESFGEGNGQCSPLLISTVEKIAPFFCLICFPKPHFGNLQFIILLPLRINRSEIILNPLRYASPSHPSRH